MNRTWPGFLPPVVALTVTVTATWFTALLGADQEGTIPAIWLLPAMVMPVAVSLAWGLALLTGRPRRFVLGAAVLWFAAALIWVSGNVTWPMLGNVAAGLMAAVAIGRRWRLDVSLLAVAGMLLPALVWALMQMSPAELIESYEPRMVEMLEESLPAGASVEDRARALETETRALEGVLAVTVRIYPWVTGIGLLGQVALILGLTGWGLRRMGFAFAGWGLPPFTRWRVPFYLVWILVAGIGLMLTRSDTLVTAGLNVALLAASVICIHGIAVQFFVTGRVMGPAVRTAYWLIMGVFFPFLILASGILLGLVDQWWDLRRLDAVEPDEEPTPPQDDEVD